ncbi:hypothetical protein JXR93_14275 [bacterium]|nr:hypothetical protein [bacterium]
MEDFFTFWNLLTESNTLTPLPFEKLKCFSTHLNSIERYLESIEGFSNRNYSIKFPSIIIKNIRYNLTEIYEKLDYNGILLIQQIRENRETNWSLYDAQKELNHFNFQILDYYESFNITKFHNISEMIYFFEQNPWNLRNSRRLQPESVFYNIINVINRERYIKIHPHYFYILAKKNDK